MADVKVGSSVNTDIPLWRYMSLDKLVNLLESDSLFFTALETYQHTDPFEGYMPRIAFEAYAKAIKPEMEDLYAEYEEWKNRPDLNSEQLALLSKMKDNIAKVGERTKKAFKTTCKGITVNCWHANECESEAMWKLYSDNGKGIAVKTSISSIVNSIRHFQQDIKVQIGAVKYLDFHDINLDPKDCVTDGHLSPLLKRSSFSHENEVRLFTIPKVNSDNLDTFKSKPEFVKAMALKLIEDIYISPFAGEPFISSVKAICNKYSIPHEAVKESDLLEGHEELLDIVSKW